MEKRYFLNYSKFMLYKITYTVFILFNKSYKLSLKTCNHCDLLNLELYLFHNSKICCLFVSFYNFSSFLNILLFCMLLDFVRPDINIM